MKAILVFYNDIISASTGKKSRKKNRLEIPKVWKASEIAGMLVIASDDVSKNVQISKDNLISCELVRD